MIKRIREYPYPPFPEAYDIADTYTLEQSIKDEKVKAWTGRGFVNSKVNVETVKVDGVEKFKIIVNDKED